MAHFFTFDTTLSTTEILFLFYSGRLTPSLHCTMSQAHFHFTTFHHLWFCHLHYHRIFHFIVIVRQHTKLSDTTWNNKWKLLVTFLVSFFSRFFFLVCFNFYYILCVVLLLLGVKTTKSPGISLFLFFVG